MPKVSIVVPVYNVEKYLRQCMDSILNQTLADIEVICVDDGSTDSSPEILKEYAVKDTRVTVLRQKNAGAGAARNTGLAKARGTYLSFLDSDDFFEPTMLEKAVRRIEEDNADFVVFRCDHYLDDLKTFKKADYTLKVSNFPPYRPFNYNQITDNVFRTFVGWAWDKVYRRSFVLDNHLLFQEQRTTNDMLFVFSALVIARKITYLDEVLAHQRRNNNSSLSNTREKSWFCFYNALCALKSFLQERGLFERLERDFVNYVVHFSLWNLNTITGPCKEKLYNKLRGEWLQNLGVLGHDRDYFCNKREYEQLVDILDYDFKEYETQISVVIPVHNGEAYIRQCLDSVLTKQDGVSVEVICVDDCSTDKTPDILHEYAEKYPNFRSLRNKNNIFAGRSRNRGLKEAHGQYIHFMDADDYAEENVYQKLYKIAHDNRLDWLKTTAEAFDDNTGKKVNNSRYSMSKMYRGFDGTLLDFHRFPQKFLDNMAVVPWNAIYNRRFLLDNNIFFNNLYCVNDRSFFIETCIKGKRMMVARHCIVHHRTNVSTSLVAKRAEHFDCQFESYKLMEKYCADNHVSEEVRYQVLANEMKDMLSWYKRFPEEVREMEHLNERIREFINSIDLPDFKGHGDKDPCIVLSETALAEDYKGAKSNG